MHARHHALNGGHPGRVPIAIVAGEASGDLLAAQLLGPLHDRIAGLDAYGIGGPRMRAERFRADWPVEKLSVMGYVEVLKRLPEIMSIRATLKRRLLADPPAAFIGIDAPDFNLGLELALREAWRGSGRRVIHVVGPSIWAWRGERIHQIKRAVDHMLVLFPFEPEIYRRAGIPATYVGHPLADVIPLAPERNVARDALGLPRDGRVVALLPGSRAAEVRYLGEPFIEAAVLLHRRHPDIRFVIPAATPVLRSRIEQLVATHALAATIVDGRSHEALAAADAVLVASGTATLETALFKRPMVIAYRVAPLTGFLMRRRGSIPWVGLPNVLSNAFVVPELLQEAVTPAALAKALEFQLCDDANRARLVERFTALHHELRRDTGRLAAEVVADLLVSRVGRSSSSPA
jgi:lipid-A-disaccharide synthase